VAPIAASATSRVATRPATATNTANPETTRLRFAVVASRPGNETRGGDGPASAVRTAPPAVTLLVRIVDPASSATTTSTATDRTGAVLCGFAVADECERATVAAIAADLHGVFGVSATWFDSGGAATATRSRWSAEPVAETGVRAGVAIVSVV
jgi:hypothetical protein